MPYRQRDLVWIKNAEMPDGKNLTHPFLILSCEAARAQEPGYYYGIMMTGSVHRDRYSFPVSKEMFEGPLQKESTHLRLYIISSFRENRINGLVTRMMKRDFQRVLDEIKNFVLVADSD